MCYFRLLVGLGLGVLLPAPAVLAGPDPTRSVVLVYTVRLDSSPAGVRGDTLSTVTSGQLTFQPGSNREENESIGYVEATSPSDAIQKVLTGSVWIRRQDDPDDAAPIQCTFSQANSFPEAERATRETRQFEIVLNGNTRTRAAKKAVTLTSATVGLTDYTVDPRHAANYRAFVWSLSVVDNFLTAAEMPAVPRAQGDCYALSGTNRLTVPDITRRPDHQTVATGVLRNDFDPQETIATLSNLTAHLFTNPLHGSVLLAGNGAFVYRPDRTYWTQTPALGANGLRDHFTYYATAECGDHDPDPRRSAVVTVEIVQGQAALLYPGEDPHARGLGGFALGGGATNDVAAAFHWFLDHANGGNVVVLSDSGTAQDEVNRFAGIISSLGAGVKKPHSVRAFVVSTPDDAEDPSLLAALHGAQAIFIQGGDQTRLVDMWTGTALQKAVQEEVSRGATLGGSSAGCALLGGVVHAGMRAGPNLGNRDALDDPYATAFVNGEPLSRVALTGAFVNLQELAGVVTDSHFGYNQGMNPGGCNRMGRMVTFLARMKSDVGKPYSQAGSARGVGINEETFLLVEQNGRAHIVGASYVYFVTAREAPIACRPGDALIYDGLLVRRVAAGTGEFQLSKAWLPQKGVFGREYHINSADNRRGEDDSGMQAVDRPRNNRSVY